MIRLLSFLVIFTCLTGQIAAAPPHDLQKRLDAWNRGQPGGIAAAWVDSSGTVLTCSGQYAADDSRQATPDTQFSIGSVTKVFTAVLLAESERRGLVARNAPAASYLLPDDDSDQGKLAAITLLALVTHRAGLPMSPDNFLEFTPGPDNPFGTYDRKAMVAALRRHGRSAPVGRAMVYSNFGMAVLGEALASAWRRDYADALDAAVLRPLGMRDTFLSLTGREPSKRLAPDHVEGVRKANYTLLAFAPAGAVCSSPRDMGISLAACLGYSDSPLQAAIGETLKPRNAAEDFGCRIAMGWFIDDDDDRMIAWHGGATAGSRAFIAFDLQRRMGVAILANSDREVLPLAFELLSSKRVELFRQPPNLKNASEYVGVYRQEDADEVTILAKEGGLVVQRKDWQDSWPLRKIDTDRYAVRMMPAEILFERDDASRVSAIVTDLEGEKRRIPLDDRSVDRSR